MVCSKDSNKQNMNVRPLLALLVLTLLFIIFLISVSNVGRSVMFYPLQLTPWCDGSTAGCWPSRRQCSPPSPSSNVNEIRQVVFIKVHKAASSTVQNILLRFTMSRNLTALLPSRGPIISQTVPVFPPSGVLPHPEQRATFDVLCNHVIYDKDQLALYFAESAPRIAILREPMKQAISALIYFTSQYHLKPLEAGLAKHQKDPINGFLEHPEDFCNEICQSHPAYSYVNNRMSVDMGFSLKEIESAKHNQTVVQAFLQKMDKEMDLVLISDCFDESMVLLRRHLRWPMRDIVYLKVNTSPRDKKDSMWSRAPRLRNKTSATFRQWAFYDYALYDHFKPIFFKKIESECFFYEEVNVYKQILNEVVKYCKKATAHTNLQVPAGKWNEAFSVTASDCDLMATSENRMVDKARKLHLERSEAYALETSRNTER